MGMLFTTPVTGRQVKRQTESYEELQAKVASMQTIMASILMAQAADDKEETPDENA